MGGREDLLPLIRREVQAILNGYVQSPAITQDIDGFIVPPGLGGRAGMLGAIALALSVTTLEVAASWLLAAWVLVMAYAFISKGMRTFAESPAPRSAVVEVGRADH